MVKPGSKNNSHRGLSYILSKAFNCEHCGNYKTIPDNEPAKDFLNRHEKIKNAWAHIDKLQWPAIEGLIKPDEKY